MRYSTLTFKMPRGCWRCDGQHHVTSQSLSGLPLGYLDFFGPLLLGFLKRTPAPPPFSSMNSTPAALIRLSAPRLDPM